MHPASRHHPGELEILLGRRRPRARLQGLLYLLTCLTTFAAGAVGWEPLLLGVDDAGVAAAVAEHWDRGLLYMAAVMAVLSAHEAGHFVAARIHGIPATLPFFIPMPVLLTGTLGAVIGMEGSRANRRELFDIAVAGPLAGLVVAVPLLALGLLQGAAGPTNPFALAPLATWIQSLVRPDLPAGTTVAPNPLFMAGWVGLLVTGLNMIPVSQLDGGHVCYAVFGPRRGNWVARTVLILSILTVIVTGQTNWVAILVIVTFLGVDHPPIREEREPIGAFRTALGLAMFAIPVLTFMPEPLLLDSVATGILPAQVGAGILPAEGVEPGFHGQDARGHLFGGMSFPRARCPWPLVWWDVVSTGKMPVATFSKPRGHFLRAAGRL